MAVAGALIGVLLALLAAAVIVWPLLRSTGDPKQQNERVAAVARIRRAREEIYQQIQQLQTDVEAGLVDDETYQTSLREFRIAAARLIRAEEAAQPEVASLDAIEQEILAVRTRLSSAKTAKEGEPSAS